MEEKKGLNMATPEIPKEILDKISGGNLCEGELDDSDKRNLDTVIASYKSLGLDQETMLRDMLDWGFSNEALWYVGTHW